MSDLIKRSDAIEAIEVVDWYHQNRNGDMVSGANSAEHQAWYKEQDIYKALEEVPSADRPQGEWIPCSERLPEDIRPVLVTWKNNDPASYYQYIVGKHFIGTAHYHRGKWYWYSSVTEDLLAEYGKCETEEFDEAIEAVAWMPLPQPWKGADDDD